MTSTAGRFVAAAGDGSSHDRSLPRGGGRAGGRAQAEFCIKYRMREVLEMMGLKAKKPEKNSMAAKATA